ncbi:GNAT family N-acetyltransferase [Microvirga tunisiensis]|uniref:GNAT family N-acetyltransferase n=1 Tax=Pannonibacter tanglangensis TaxID=2750084 RepID=A0A7X5F3B9_9HYPH|nr:GNAT family N-acetyltransferase [Pannonibacter sp. XCT-53]NBN78986.1 GNAT family N-acetyltransferase [Pannonibacter sp. XCT-53]
MTRAAGLCLLLGGPGTCDTIIDLARQFWAEAGESFTRRQEDALRTLMVDASLGRAWLAQYRNEPAGFAVALYRHSIGYGGRVALLDDLYVVEKLRGRGLGRRMLRAITEDLEAFGILQVHALAPRHSAAADLYESEGFLCSRLQLLERPFDQDLPDPT